MSDYWFILGSKSGRKQNQNTVLTIYIYHFLIEHKVQYLRDWLLVQIII